MKTTLSKTTALKKTACAVALLCLASDPLSAAIVVWNGNANDGLFATGGNWVGGNAPANNDFTADTAQFDAGTPIAITVAAGRDHGNIDFNTAGWTIQGGDFDNLRVVESNGAGTNIISTTINMQGSRTWTVGAENILRVNNIYLRANTITLTGGGILRSNTALAGFGGSNVYGINIGAATFQMDVSAIFGGGTSTGTRIRLDDVSSVFDLFGTVGNANTLITNGKITDNTGSGLNVTNLGNGYARITVVPEPSHGLLLMGGLLAVGMRRKR